MRHATRLLVIAVICALTAVTATVASPGCLEHVNIHKAGFTVTCQRESSKVKVEVTCPQDHVNGFPDIKINSSLVDTTTFINCNSFQNQSLLDVFHAMNINYSTEIYFKNLRSSPSRQHFRNLSVNQITFSNCNLTDSSSDMLYELSNLKKLIIRDYSVFQIPDNFFNDWSKHLQQLNIMTARLQTIKKVDFSSLTELTELILYETEITEIEAGAFDNLSNLKTLDISDNKLHVLPPGLFRYLTNLDFLSLNTNPLDELPRDLLSGINDSHLKDFRMNYMHGSLKTLPSEFFKKLPFLREVRLEASQLQSLTPDLFAETTELEKLNLKNNSLTSLPSGFFNSFQKLRKLALDNNQIATLPDGIFENLVNLIELDISYNNLTTLSSNVLRGLSALTTLYASHNNLTKVDGNLCSHLTSVENVDFSFNRLSFRSDVAYSHFPNPSIFYSCNNLKDTNLSHNMATGLFDDTGFRGNIDLSHNNLTKLTAEDIDEGLRAIETLDLRYNSISTIDLTELSTVIKRYEDDGNVVSNSKIKIILGNNPLHCDCHLIDFIRYWNSERDSKSWQYVKLMVSKVDGANHESIQCATPAELKQRDISNLRIEELNCPLKTESSDDACTSTCACREYPGKQVLAVDCSRNNLRQLPDVISNARNWSIELNMSYNMLTQTPSLDKAYMPKVTSLDLSNNNISSVTIDVFSENLVDLKLHNNSISRLDKKFIEHLENSNVIRTLTLHQNPWLCDCEAKSFFYFVQQKNLYYGLDDVACQGTNEKLKKMTLGDLCKDAIAMIVCASLLVAIFSIAIGILAALYYKYQKEVKVWLYSKQWCLWFVTEDELDKDKKYDAFVSFSHKDEDFVEKEIVATLEDGPRPYKLCLHYRDWLAGEWIPVQISQSVEESRRTIVVLSPNFVESVWGRMEFRAAHTQALKEGRARVIIILYGDIENMMDDLDPELKAYLSLNTYLKWGDPWFWDKLRYALPHRFEPSKRKTKNARIIEDHLVRPSVNNDSANAIAKVDVISMSKLANDSAKLLDSTPDERMTASC